MLSIKLEPCHSYLIIQGDLSLLYVNHSVDTDTSTGSGPAGFLSLDAVLQKHSCVARRGSEGPQAVSLLSCGAESVQKPHACKSAVCRASTQLSWWGCCQLSLAGCLAPAQLCWLQTESVLCLCLPDPQENPICSKHSTSSTGRAPQHPLTVLSGSWSTPSS